ncbi:MAG TPA: GntR family transcriptional regulator [Stellaceae bacterium]|nr:GntR family transcriptional regulator [Stellaceae bacterium]
MPAVNSQTALPSPLDGDRPIPLYEHVKRQISEAILMGAWAPGTVLPGEIALASQYGVAVGTIRRALADLTAEGMLVRRRKTGTVVTGRSPHHSLRNIFQYFRLHGADGALLRSTPEVLSLARRGATAEEASALRVEPGTPLVHVHRRRLVAGVPIMHETLLLPAARLPDFPTKAKALPALIYLHLLERYGIRVSAVRESLTAAVASTEDRRVLELRAPAAVLVIDEVAYDQAGDPIILAHHRAHTEGCCYLNEIR